MCFAGMNLLKKKKRKKKRKPLDYSLIQDSVRSLIVKDSHILVLHQLKIDLVAVKSAILKMEQTHRKQMWEFQRFRRKGLWTAQQSFTWREKLFTKSFGEIFARVEFEKSHLQLTVWKKEKKQS